LNVYHATKRITNEAKRPDHIVLNFSKNCGGCHTIKAISWTGERAFHNRTGFPLTGAHQIISCDKCHIDWKFDVLIPTVCYPCHRIQYENAKNPNHLTAGFPTTCATCHTSSGWRPASNFDHSLEFIPENIVGNGIVVMIAILIQTTTRISHA
jgi:hypothetical protein